MNLHVVDPEDAEMAFERGGAGSRVRCVVRAVAAHATWRSPVREHAVPPLP